MIKNYFKTAWRNFGKSRMHSFINIAGLSMGMAVTILIGLWIYDELSFDKNFTNYHRIAKVIQNVTNNGEVQTWQSVPYPLAEELRKHYGSDFKRVVMAAGWGDHIITLKDKKLKQTGAPTTDIWNSTSGFSWPEKDPNLSIDFGVVSASYDYGKTIGWEVKEGRGFSKDFATDSSAFILNEAAVNFMGIKNPVGKTVSWWGHPFNIIGVVHDMVMESPYAEPKPVIYNLSGEPGNIVILKINPSVSAKDALSKIEPVFKKYNTQQPFEYKFVDDDYAKKFGDEERIAKLAGFSTVLAIAISCLGLFGLTSFVAEQRKKEIGVRKVLGASVFGVWNLLSLDFVKLIVISFFIAIPLSYYFMHNWLLNYQYRTALSWWIFVLACSGAIVITLMTVSFQAIKAALTNPVNSLRTE